MNWQFYPRPRVWEWILTACPIIFPFLLVHNPEFKIAFVKKTGLKIWFSILSGSSLHYFQGILRLIFHDTCHHYLSKDIFCPSQTYHLFKRLGVFQVSILMDCSKDNNQLFNSIRMMNYQAAKFCAIFAILDCYHPSWNVISNERTKLRSLSLSGIPSQFGHAIYTRKVFLQHFQLSCLWGSRFREH